MTPPIRADIAMLWKFVNGRFPNKTNNSKNIEMVGGVMTPPYNTSSYYSKG